MKLVYEISGKRETKCYVLHDDGKKDYIDFWNIKIDQQGAVNEFNSWKPQKIRDKNYKILAEKRSE